MVSIIIPAYNVEKYIDRCLKSVVRQTYDDIEIILINDGSTDGTAEKCRKWAEQDKRIVFISHENKGQGMSRNEGIELSKGLYLYFVDADDYISEDAVEKLAAAMDKYELDICMGGCRTVVQDENGFVQKEIAVDTRKFPFDEPTNLFKRNELLNIMPAVLWSNMYRKSLFIENNIKMPDIATEDAAVVPMLLLKANKIFKIKDVVYNYIVNRKDSTMNSKTPVFDFIDSFRQICAFYKQNNCFEIFKRRLAYIFKARCEFFKNKYKAYVSNEEYLSLDKDIQKFYDDNFYGIKLSGNNIAVFGNEFTLNSVNADNEIVYYYDMRNFKSGIDRILSLKKDIVKGVDYIILDYLRLNIKSNNNSEEQCIKFVKAVKRLFKDKKIILFENYLLESDSKNNNALCEFYKKTIEITDNIYVIKNDINEILYSDENIPYIYNNFLYEFKGEMLKNIL